MRQNDSSRESPEVESMRPVKGETRQNVGECDEFEVPVSFAASPAQELQIQSRYSNQ
jgi:hypothetical protein